MKRTFFAMMILALAVTLIAPASVEAQTSSTQTWTSSIYYYNPDPNPDGGSVSVTYYTQTTGTSSSPTIPVASHGSGEIFIGDVGVGVGFKGSAVLNSDVPVMAVYEQAPGGKDPNYGRLLYTAFDVSQGSQRVYIPNFVYNVAGYSTQVGIQKISGNVGTVTLHFFSTAGVETLFTSPILETPRSWIFTGADIAGLPNPFDGSVWIDAGEGSSIVAAAEELQSNGRRAYAFEGVATPSSTVYMPTMMCRFAPGNQTSVYAIQNAGDQDASVRVDLYNDATRKLLKTYNLPAAIKPGAKYSLDLCKISGTIYKGGTAVITSTNGMNLAVVGKVGATTGLATSFTGKAQGSTRTILPYIVWSANAVKGYRTTISIMNVGGAPAGDVRAVFYKPDGTESKTIQLSTATKPLASFIKVKTDPSLAKALRSDGSYRGGVEILSDQPVVVVVRIERKISGVKGYTLFGEDYIGVAP